MRELIDSAEFRALIERARERHLISDVVGRHTDLKKRGSTEMSGLCPFHSERTPSFEVNDAKGTYYCHGCGKGGDALTFLVEYEGMRFRQALEYLLGENLPVISEEERVRRKEADAKAQAERIALARSIWQDAVPAVGTPAEFYARARGITIALPPTIRFATIPRWRDAETGQCGPDHPAMICAMQNVDGDVTAVQAIFLKDGGARKYEGWRADNTPAKAKLTYGSFAGAALRLGPVREHLVVCEGPEDALTITMTAPDHSVWCACGTANLALMRFPPAVRTICFAGDNGKAGHAAIVKAEEAAQERGLLTRSVFPPDEYKDWNDQLRGIAA